MALQPAEHLKAGLKLQRQVTISGQDNISGSGLSLEKPDEVAIYIRIGVEEFGQKEREGQVGISEHLTVIMTGAVDHLQPIHGHQIEPVGKEQEKRQKNSGNFMIAPGS